jgi:hypothetical protein
VASPYYREQPAKAQTNLLVYWSTLAIFAGVGLRHYWRVMTSLPPDAGRVRFVLPLTARKSSLLGTIVLPLLSVATNLTVIVVFSGLVADMSLGQGTSMIWFSPLIGATSGFMVGQTLLLFLTTPTYFCDNGVAFFRGFAPWRSIHSAKWRPGSERVLMLHQLVGDLILTIPPGDRDALEAFVRTKTTFVESSSDSHEKPPACAGG